MHTLNQARSGSPTEGTERTESSCREEPPTDHTDLHRSYGALRGRSSVEEHITESNG